MAKMTVLSTVQDLLPEVEIMTHPIHGKIQQVESFFNQLDEVYMTREKHSLHWAFNNASTQINNRLQDLETKKNTDKGIVHMSDNAIGEMKSSIKRASRRYEILSRITLFLDVVISVMLILGITLIAQHIERNLESIAIITIFIGLIALFKVSLDRFYIIPRIDEWGWNRYHNLTHSLCESVTETLLIEIANKNNIEDHGVF